MGDLIGAWDLPSDSFLQLPSSKSQMLKSPVLTSSLFRRNSKALKTRLKSLPHGLIVSHPP
jgi:hypothetical protein